MTRRRLISLFALVLLVALTCACIDPPGGDDGVTMEEHDLLYDIMIQPTPTARTK